MSDKTREMLQLVDMLPETEQDFIGEMIKRVVLAWDPDFTKTTPGEKCSIEIAEKEFENGEVVSHQDVWDNI